jgi:hypothetical protein
LGALLNVVPVEGSDVEEQRRIGYVFALGGGIAVFVGGLVLLIGGPPAHEQSVEGSR